MKNKYLNYLKSEFNELRKPIMVEERALYSVIEDMFDMLNVNYIDSAFNVLKDNIEKYRTLIK